VTDDLDPPRFRMNDVTTAAGEALKRLSSEERTATRRQVDIVLQGVIDGLKALDTARTLEVHGSRAMLTGESWVRVTTEGVELIEPYDIASPND
jgi:hypothetical protein